MIDVRKAALATGLLLSFSAPGFQDAGPAGFSAYPALAPFQGKPAQLDSNSHVYARRYKTVLSSALASGPNFAGRYVIASWGCGTSCMAHAIVDATTGKVYVPKAIESSGMNFTCEAEPLVFWRTSRRLLHLKPVAEDTVAVDEYLWEDNWLRLIGTDKRRMSQICN